MSKKLFGATALAAVIIGGAAGRLSLTPQVSGLEASLAQAQKDTRYLCDYAYTDGKIIDGCEDVYQQHISEGGPGALLGFVSEVHGRRDIGFVKGGAKYAYYPTRGSFLASRQTARAGAAGYAQEGGPSLGDFTNQHVDEDEDGPQVIAPSSGPGPDGVLPAPRPEDEAPVKEENVGWMHSFFGEDEGLPPKGGKPAGKKPAS